MTEVEAISSAMLFQATQIQLPPSPSQLPSPRLRSKPSRLPVLRKSASHSGGSLRPQLSRDHLSASNVEIHQAYLLPSSPRALLKRAATTSRIPSQSSSSSSSSDQGDPNFTGATASSNAKIQPRKMGSNNSLNGSIIAAFSIAQSLKARTSSNSLQTGISISITRKASGSLGSPMHSPSLGSPMYSPSLIGSPMQSPSYTGSPTYSPSKVGPKNWRTTDMSGAYGPVLSRKSSNSGLRQPTPVSKGMLICGLNSPAEIPKPVVRHHNSTGIPTTPRAAKSIRLPQSGPRMATSAAKPRQVASADPLSPPTGELRKMSQSLRDTIRAAREAKQRKESVSTNGTTVNGLDGFDFGTQDPFNNPDIIIGQPGSDDEGSAVGDDEVEEVEGEKGMIKVGRSGVLDLSNQGLGELSAELFDTILGSPYTILLTNNLFTTIPSNVDHFASLTSINLSGNHFDADFLPQKLMLRSLDTLNLRNTGIESLEPLFRCLDAPKLIVLDISANRVCSIEGLRQAFPALMTLQASDNQVVEIPIESIDGVRSIDLSGNSIAVLPPQLALLENLRELKVQGNLFRVPRWQVLEKGTEAIMSWLHDRLPVEDGGVVEE